MLNFTLWCVENNESLYKGRVPINMRYISCLHWVYDLLRETSHKYVKSEITKLKNSPKDMQKKYCESIHY